MAAPPVLSPEDAASFTSSTFDILIVGGGTAGLVLAARLSENPGITVGVIEAGRSHLDDPMVDIPGLARVASMTPDYGWGFKTVSQANAGGRNIDIARGKALGGSSAVNYMAWDRASKPEYDTWSSFGSSDWSFDALLTYFKRSETVLSAPNLLADVTPSLSSASGTEGPIQNSYYSHAFPISLTTAETFNNLGVPTNTSPESGSTSGVVSMRAAVDKQTGKRSYVARDYFNKPQKSNLQILTGAHVTKVLFDSTDAGLLATGIEFSAGGSLHTVRASKEVIVSAGTLQTPQILELSGIGDPSILSKFDIPVLAALPSVGENLQEHCFSFGQWQLPHGTGTFDALKDTAFAEEQRALYTKTGTGLLANSDSLTVWLPARDLVSEARYGELLALFDEEIANADPTSLKHAQFIKQRELFTNKQVPAAEILQWSIGLVTQPGESYATIVGGIMHPTSRGSVHIASGDSLTLPAVDLGFLNTKFDQELLIDIMKYVFKVGETEPFKSQAVAQNLPPAKFSSDAELLGYIQHTCANGGHLVGTAIMAPQNLGGVVDSKLKVYGTRNLRVVDASIIPTQLSAHIQATVYAIAEKAADTVARELAA